MANEEQLAILRQGVEVWNDWRKNNHGIAIDLSNARLWNADLPGANLRAAYLGDADLRQTDLSNANLLGAYLGSADLSHANLRQADLHSADLREAELWETDLRNADLSAVDLWRAKLSDAYLSGADFSATKLSNTVLGNIDLREAKYLDKVIHSGPSTIGTDTIALSKGKIPEAFLRGCGLSDWEIEQAKLNNPGLSNDEITLIQYRVYELRATQAIQISPLFISYSHSDSSFVDKLEKHLNAKGVRFWRDNHDLKSGRIEKQIDRAIRQNPTVLLVLSENSLSSDWVEHEVRTARGLEKDMRRDVLCPVALDNSWKSSPWPKRVMEQIMEYNILDFSAWEDDSKFDDMFRKLIDGLQLFYKG